MSDIKRRAVRHTAGIQAIPGPQGEPGPAGVQGPRGDTGPAGPNGAAGARGEQGARGFDGPPGPPGPNGATGPTGPAGPKGDKGDFGNDGVSVSGVYQNDDHEIVFTNSVFGEWNIGKVPALPTGGEVGQVLVKASEDDFDAEWVDAPEGGSGGSGANGKSAYEVAVANGFVGTEAQWLTSLRGAAGSAGPKGDKGDRGDTGPAGAASTVPGPQGPKGDKGDIGSVGPAGTDGQGVPAGGLAGQVLVKTSDADFAAEWVDFPFDAIQQMIDEAIANGGGGGTDPEPEPEPEPVDPTDPDGMTVVRWTPNGLTTPITASNTAWPNAALVGTTATAQGSALVLNKDSWLNMGTVNFGLDDHANYLLRNTPSIFRMTYKGILKADVENVITFMRWGAADVKIKVPWMADQLACQYNRGGDGNPEVGEDISCIADFKLGENHLYDVIWSNDVNGPGGNVTFLMDGVLMGVVPTGYKVRLCDEMTLNVNASLGNDIMSRDGLLIDYLEIGFKA